MPDSMVEQLEREVDCEWILERFHGLKRLDMDVFRALTDADDPMTVDELAAIVERERSTAYRAVQRLLQAGLIRKEQVNYDRGGYCHVYEPTDSSNAAEDMQRLLNDWYAKVGQLIYEFESKYEQSDGSTRSRDG